MRSNIAGKTSLALFAATLHAQPLYAQQSAATRADASLVYSTAYQATIFGYPLDGMYRRLTGEVLDAATRKAPFNAWYHYRNLATPAVSPFPAPNNDTLYSTAWIDLRKEPAILSMPDTAGRYYTAHVMDFTTETIANIGQRLNGTEAGLFAIVGPGWKGELPAGVKGVVRSETAFAYVLLRLLVDGPADVAAVNALQDRFKIASLSRHLEGKTGAGDAGPPAPYAATTAADRMAMLDRIIRFSPVRPADSGMVSTFANIGVGPYRPGLAIKPGADALARAEKDARALIASAGARTGKFVNGWRMPPAAIGIYGVDYLQRASVWDGGPLANVTEESFYPAALLDNAGRMLNGANARYTLKFPAGQLPPAGAFWSLTMYRLDDKNLVANAIERYSIGNRTKGLVTAPDGSLTIHLQADAPVEANMKNWLPAPRAPFYMVLRLYGPAKAALTGEWTPPPVERAGGDAGK